MCAVIGMDLLVDRWLVHGRKKRAGGRLRVTVSGINIFWVNEFVGVARMLLGFGTTASDVTLAMPGCLCGEDAGRGIEMLLSR